MLSLFKKTKRKKRKPARRRTATKKPVGRKPAAKRPAPKKVVAAKPATPAPAAKGTATPPTAKPAAPAPAKPTPAPKPPPRPPEALPADTLPSLSGGPVPVYAGSFGAPEAERLLWRAGFGPRPGDVDRLVAMGLDGAVTALTQPVGQPTLAGPEPRDEKGPIDPINVPGHEHLWWLDRMVRSDQPLVERMTLVWHDWFACSRNETPMRHLLPQNELFRRRALGSFKDLVLDVTQDAGMLHYLNGISNRVGRPNENYARELMELFTLGADRGAYTESDVREQARALTGWRADSLAGTGYVNFRWEAQYWDATDKTVFGHTGNWDWRAAVELCLRNLAHLSFFISKLWSYFIAVPPDDATEKALCKLYRTSGWSIQAVLEAILKHPALYTGGPMVKPPVVLEAGMMRALGQAVDRAAWTSGSEAAGQRLFSPPNVAGWEDSRWLDTSTILGRWNLVAILLSSRTSSGSTYSRTETPGEALSSALAFWANPASLRPETVAALQSFSQSAVAPAATGTTAGNQRAARQNALRHLIATSPDYQTS